MGLSLNACVLLSYYVLTMHCGSSLVLSPSFYRFHEKWPYQEKKLSSSERTKNRGSIRHRPPPRPPLINNFLSYDDSCLPCGNNICLIRMFLQTDIQLSKKHAFEINVTTTRQTTSMKTQKLSVRGGCGGGWWTGHF